MKHFYISVAGVMGSGKTTVSRLLADQLGWHLFEENVSQNIFLPRYYANPKAWAFHSQLFYLREKAEQLMKVKELLSSVRVIQDTPIYQDCFAYAKAQAALGQMTDEEYRFYLKFFELLQPQLPVPNLIIQLDAALPVLEERIKSRGREYEKAVNRDYLRLLSGLQNDWIKKNPELQVMRLPTDNREFDLITSRSYQEELIKKITAAVGRLS